MRVGITVSQTELNSPADEIAFRKWQQHAVYSRIFFSTVQDLGLKAGGSYIVDHKPAAGHKARDHFLVDFGVQLRGLKIGKAKRDVLNTRDVVESIAVNGLN